MSVVQRLLDVVPRLGKRTLQHVFGEWSGSAPCVARPLVLDDPVDLRQPVRVPGQVLFHVPGNVLNRGNQARVLPLQGQNMVLEVQLIIVGVAPVSIASRSST
jgi:hypothetical protein